MRQSFNADAYHQALEEFDGMHCLYCGAELPERKRKPHPRAVEPKCCNKACYDLFIASTIKDWSKLRLEAIKRDNYTCQDCGYMAPQEFKFDFIDYDWRDMEKFGPMPPKMSYYEWVFQCGYKAKVSKHWQTDKGLEVHHIHPIKDGGEEFDLANLVTLCVECHKGRHAAKPKPPRVKKEILIRAERIADLRKHHITLENFGVKA